MWKKIAISVLIFVGLIIAGVVVYSVYQFYYVVMPLDHGAYIRSANFSSDGKYVFTYGYDYVEKTDVEKTWDITNGKLIKVSAKPDPRMFERKFFSPDGKRILVADRENAKLLDKDGALVAELGPVHWAGFSADGKQLVTLRGYVYVPTSDFSKRDFSTRITFWDINGKMQSSFKAYEYHHNFNYAQPSNIYDMVQFNKDGTQILTVGCDEMGVSGFDVGRCILGSARLWDTKGNLLKEFFKGGAVDYAEYSRDGTWIVAAGCDKYSLGLLGIYWCDANRVRIYKSDGELIAKMNESALIATFSPDKTRLLTVDGNTAKLWKIGK